MLPSCQKGKLGSRASPSRQYRLAPGSHSAATVPLLPLSVQQQYQLPPGSHPAAQRQYRGRERGAAAAGWLPEGNRYCLCTDRGGEARPLLDGCRKVTGTVSLLAGGKQYFKLVMLKIIYLLKYYRWIQ